LVGQKAHQGNSGQNENLRSNQEAIMKPGRFCFVFVLLAAGLAWGQQGKAPTAATRTHEPKFKAIWEPVNYSEDAELNDVFFVSPEVGWVAGLKRTDAGEGGFIIHTTDGGEHWNLQMGDPHSATRSITNLFFLDPTHGWAGQFGGQLLRTTDGDNWESAGEYGTLHPYNFVSPTTGFSIDGGQLNRSDDAGNSWKTSFTCRASVEVQGLKHDDDCRFQSLHFATAQVGYVASSQLSDKSSAVFKTTDGGNVWTLVAFLPTDAQEFVIGFADAQTGFIKTSGGLMGTFDGGHTWKGVGLNINGDNPIRFAGNVGWDVESNVFTYTGNGGKRWLSANLHLPTGVRAFSLPAPDRGYVVGDHGMIYRYRIVPIAYTSKGMLPATSMPAP
jgi:photosystem II stability/assembly factor-like uncharacterized protein